MRLSFRPVAILAALAAAACASAPEQSTLASRYLTGRVAAGSNSLDIAATAFADAHAAAPRERAILEDALFYHLAAGDIDAAAPLARGILALESAGAPAPAVAGGESGPDGGLARVTLAAQSLKAGRLREARGYLAGDIKTPYLKSIAFLIDVWIEKGLVGAGAAIEKIDNPGADMFSGFNALHKALLADEAGRADEARTAYQAAVFGLGGPVGRVAYGAFLERAGENDAARAYYEILEGGGGPSRRAAQDAYKRLSSGASSRAHARTAPAEGAAIALFSHAGAIVEYSSDTRSRAISAGFHVGEPQLDLPLALARLALYLDPKREEARRLIGWIVAGYGDYERAAEVLVEIPSTSPHFEQARIEMAGALISAGRSDAAMRLLKDAIRHDPPGIELTLMLGQLYASEGRQSQAVAAFTRVVESLDGAPQDDSWRYYIARGDALLQMGRWPEAEADLKQAVAIAPEEPTTLNYLGYSWAERGINLDEAFRMIEKAVELLPQSGAIIDSLGWAHFQLGRYHEAVVNLEKAVTLEPGDPTITDHLGDAYWRLGRRVEARYEWRRALQLEPSEKLTATLTQKLEHGLTTDDNSRAE